MTGRDARRFRRLVRALERMERQTHVTHMEAVFPPGYWEWLARLEYHSGKRVVVPVGGRLARVDRFLLVPYMKPGCTRPALLFDSVHEVHLVRFDP